jgi:hypothetical protein
MQNTGENTYQVRVDISLHLTQMQLKGVLF